MTRHFALPFVALGALFVPPAAPATPQEDLRAELATARQQIQDLTAEVAELSQLVDGVVGYLHVQAQSAEAMRGTLASAEAAGFTAGINFKSREILLQGWREQLDAATSSLPGAKPAPQGRPGQ